MTETISLPLWLVLVCGLLAAWAVLDRLLKSSVRWGLRRGTNRVIDALNVRLRIEVQPFSRTQRQVLIDRLLYDSKNQDTTEAHARTHEIVPAFNAYVYFRFGYWLARHVARLLDRVRLAYADQAGLAAIPRGATVVFVMKHRSNMDYILVAYLAADQTTLSNVVGEWTRIWPLQTLIRAMGAYFVRHNSRGTLYAGVPSFGSNGDPNRRSFRFVETG